MGSKGNWIVREVALTFRHPQNNIKSFLAAAAMSLLHRPAVKVVIRKLGIKPDDNVLEVGFGPGFGMKYACKFVNKGRGAIFGVDCSNHMVQQADYNCMWQIDRDRVKLFHGTVDKLPFGDNFIDAAFHCNCFYYWPNLQKACAELYRVLRPGAGMIASGIVESMKSSRRFPRDIYLHSDWLAYIDALKAAGFVDVRIVKLRHRYLFFRSFTAVFASKPLNSANSIHAS